MNRVAADRLSNGYSRAFAGLRAGVPTSLLYG